jgi:hypothetical protein
MLWWACRVDPFAKDSPLKAMAVEAFPPDFFFVLRVLQLLRCGLPTAPHLTEMLTSALLSCCWGSSSYEETEGGAGMRHPLSCCH